MSNLPPLQAGGGSPIINSWIQRPTPPPQTSFSSGAKLDRSAGTPRTRPSTRRSARAFSQVTRRRRAASCGIGSKRRKARWLSSSCSTSFRAICFAAPPTLSQPMPRRFSSPTGPLRAASIQRSKVRSGNSSICLSCMPRTLALRSGAWRPLSWPVPASMRI